MAKLEAVEMPRLHGLDEQPIARDEGAIQLGKMGSTLIPVGLLTVIIRAVVVASTAAPPPPRNTAREEPRELVDRLLREVQALEEREPEARRGAAASHPHIVRTLVLRPRCAIVWH
jgi:hypothetical protein